MVNKRRKYSSEFKVKVVLEALSDRQSKTELAKIHAFNTIISHPEWVICE